ncbi:putative protein K02A2.6, partial [Dissostichus eleginoides]
MCSEEEDEWIESVQLNGEETVFKLDTGASVTAISSSNYSSKKHGPLQPPHKVLYGPGNQRLKVKGRFEELGPYWPERETLTLAGDLLLRGQRILIPQSMREEILNDLHSGHQGIVKCRARARQSVWWPGLSVVIAKLVESCNTCSQHRADQREPLLTTPVQEKPWQRVGTDLFFWEKKTYLLIVDYFSRYIEVAQLNIATANTVIAALKESASSNPASPMAKTWENSGRQRNGQKRTKNATTTCVTEPVFCCSL